MEKSKDDQPLDLTDEEYLILDTVAKDINMIQLLYKIPKEKIRKLLTLCNDSCNSHIFFLSFYRIEMDVSLILPMIQYVKLYNKKYNIMIYLFGEQHLPKNNCRDSIGKIISELDNYPYLIDIFTELPRYSLQNMNTRPTSENLNLMKDFHNHRKYSKNIRTHEVDIRYLEEFHHKHFEILTNLNNNDYKIQDNDVKEMTVPIPNVIIDRVRKQISEMYDNKYKNVMEELLDASVIYLNHLRKRINTTVKYTKEELLDAMTLMTFNGLLSIMDIYIVARMHRDFSKKIMNKNNCSARPHNIIYISGLGHTLIAKYYLQLLDYKILVDNSASPSQICLKIRDDSPLFFRPI